jgi:hypothetical protein
MSVFAFKPVKAIACICAIVLAMAVSAISWKLTHPQVARVTFAPSRYCLMEVYPFYTRGGVISYYENGRRVGSVKLSNDFLYDPLAIFAGPDGHSIICLSWPDTFDAAFTIDFSQPNTQGDLVENRLRNIVVDSSDFEARACTTREVAFVRHFLETSSLKTLASCTRWGANGETEDTRQYLLFFLKVSTSVRGGPDPDLKDSSPLILPNEGVLVEDSGNSVQTRNNLNSR